jgi:hypothetical protein
MSNNLSFGKMSPQMGNANQILSQPNALSQIGPSSPSFQPGLMPPPQVNIHGAPQGMPPLAPQPIPGSQPTPGQVPMSMGVPGAPPVGPQPIQQGGVVGMPPSNPEAMAIVKALSNRINAINKAEEMQRGGGL